MVTPSNKSPHIGPSERDLVGSYDHQRLNKWDYIAAVPLIGNVTSFGRAVGNMIKLTPFFYQKVFHNSVNTSCYKYKVSMNHLKKSAAASIPVVGTVFAVYILYKDHDRRKPQPDIPLMTYPQYIEYEAKKLNYDPDQGAYDFLRGGEEFENSQNSSQVFLVENYFTKRTPQEDAADFAKDLNENINIEKENDDVKKLFGDLKSILESFARDDDIHLGKLQNFDFDTKIKACKIVDKRISDLIPRINARIDALIKFEQR